MKTRIIVGGIIYNQEDSVLLLKMAAHGVYPNQWGLVGGGMETGEKMFDTLEREVVEEVGLELERIEPFWFHDTVKNKKYADGSMENIYMIFLLCEAYAKSDEVRLNDEWVDFAWVKPTALKNYDLNEATVKTFAKKGWL